mgnify:CR=1 FL=1
MPFDITKASHEVSKLGVKEIYQPLQKARPVPNKNPIEQLTRWLITIITSVDQYIGLLL